MVALISYSAAARTPPAVSKLLFHKLVAQIRVSEDNRRMTKQYTIEFKRTHSSEFAERAGIAPDQFMAIVYAPEFREDGSSWPKCHFIVEAKTRATVKRAAEKFIREAVAQ